MTLAEKIAAIKERLDGVTPGPWFLHDFTDKSINPDPRARDVTVSCDHPATITVAEMGGGLEGSRSLDQARNDAAYITAVDPQTVAAIIDRYERMEKALGAIAKDDVSYAFEKRDIAREALGDDNG